jgi:hypothetical protein
MKTPLSGGTPVTLASEQTEISNPAIDASKVYWGTSNGSGAVMMVPLAGGMPTTLSATAFAPTNLVVDATGVYAITSPSIVKVPLGGGSPVNVAQGNEPAGIAMDATHLYWTDYGGGSIGWAEK